MPTSYTYTSLKAAIVAIVEETGTEFAGDLDILIPLAEDKVLRDLDLELFDETFVGTLTADSPWLTKPTGILGVRTLHYTDASGNYQLLEPRSWAFCKDYWPKAATTTATPKYFSEFSDTSWMVAGTPSSELTVTARCIKRPAGLDGSTSTTWLSQHAGDLLLFAALELSEMYLKSDERIPTWKQGYLERLVVARNELKPETRVDYMPIDPAPTAKG